MASANRIIKFIKECFADYGLRLEEHFYYDYDGNGKPEEITWTDETGELLPGLISFASEILGMSEQDIIACDDAAVMKRYRKYPYFGLLGPYAVAYERTFFNGPAYDESRLAEILIGEKLPTPTRFDYEDVKKRLVAQLKEYDKSIPGTYHEGAYFKKLRINTENFCHFDKMEEMVNSYLAMADEAVALFLKAVRQDLAEEEINDYNLLVSVLGLRDRYYTGGFLYYNGLVQAREIYASVTKENLLDSIIFKHFWQFKPWQCADFVENRELVTRFLVVFPDAKSIMRDYAMRVSQFECIFTWSDAKPVQYTPEEEAEFAFIDKMLGEDAVPLEERPKEQGFVYVAKTAAELDGDDAVSQKLTGYCRPARLGGIGVDAPKHSSTEMVAHIQFLLGKVPSNEYADRLIADLNSSGGGDHG